MKTPAGIGNHLAAHRQKRGLSAAELAERTGIRRQTIYAMEAGSYVPNTVVALRLARILEVSVEDLFSLGGDAPAGAARTEQATLLPCQDSPRAGEHVQLCRVDRRLVASAPSPLPWYLPTADAVVVRNGAQQSISLTVGQLPDPPINPTMSGEADTWVQNLELAVANSTNAIRKALKADEDNGLVVTQLRRLGAGGLAGLRIGDLITHAGSQPLQRVAELASVAPPSPQEPLLLRIVRGGSPRFVAVTGIEDRQPLDTQ